MSYRSLVLACLLSLFASGAWAHPGPSFDPGLPDDAPLHTGITLDLGITAGGDNLLRNDIAGPYADDSYMGAGSGIYFGPGLVELFGSSRLGLKQELNYTFNDSCSWFDESSHVCRYLFSHLNFTALALLGVGGDSPWSTVLGAGVTYHRQPFLEVDNSDARVLYQTDFDSAHGWIVQAQWERVGLRFTHIAYRLQGSSVSVDASNIGVFFTWEFGD